MIDDHEHAYELVMPFVTVQSKGGPHEDTSYVCGYEMGRLDTRLEMSGAHRFEHVIQTDNVRQADLIAMRRGYRMSVIRQDEGWVNVRFERAQGGESGGARL